MVVTRRRCDFTLDNDWPQSHLHDKATSFLHQCQTKYHAETILEIKMRMRFRIILRILENQSMFFLISHLNYQNSIFPSA